MEKTIARSICLTKFLVEKDCLTAAMTRFGHGFHPPSVVSEVKDHLANIQILIHQMEKIAQTPKGYLVQFERDCCGK